MVNFKQMTAVNWPELDPVLRLFVRLNARTGEIGGVSAEEWVNAFMEPQLANEVPERVAELVEAARGTMLYRWFFYPLYAVAEDQLFIAAEAALRAKYVALTGTRMALERLPRFKGLHAWALKNGLIPKGDEIWWCRWSRKVHRDGHEKCSGLGGQPTIAPPPLSFCWST